MDNEKLATELLHEIKASAKRWFIAFCIMVFLELATICGFMWYISLPAEEVTTIENDEGNANYIGGNVNGVLNNGKGEDNSKENQTQTSEE